MNGIILNGHKIRKASVILMDGDIIEIPSSQSTFLSHLGCPQYLILRYNSVQMRSYLERTAWKREHIWPYAVKSSFLQSQTDSFYRRRYILTSPKQIGRYTVTSHCLGSGSFATVHLALDTVEHRQVACKMIRTRKEESMSKVWKEVRILMALNHVSRHF